MREDIAQIMPVECDDGRIEQLDNEVRIRGKLLLGNVPEVPYVTQPYEGLRNLITLANLPPEPPMKRAIS